MFGAAGASPALLGHWACSIVSLSLANDELAAHAGAAAAGGGDAADALPARLVVAGVAVEREQKRGSTGQCALTHVTRGAH
tara:strand:- start:369 stop:611 length:243 start_codon:yes stop_codon:yes gene_type:complete